MIQTLSSLSPPELLAKWSEVPILSRAQIFGNPSIASTTFYDTHHRGLIVEGPVVGFDVNDLSQLPYEKRFENQIISGNFSPELLGLETPDPQTHTEAVFYNIKNRGMCANYKLTDKLLWVIAGDFVTLHHAYGANEFWVSCFCRTSGTVAPHRDGSGEALAVRAIHPIADTTLIYKDGNIDKENLYDYQLEWDGISKENIVRVPEHALLAFKTVSWGCQWLDEKYAYEGHKEFGRDKRAMEAAYLTGLPHSSPNNAADHILLKYRIGYEDPTHTKMMAAPRARLASSIPG